MIDDRFPELKNLAPEEKMELASELVREAQKAEGLPELNEDSVAALERELADIIEDPSKGTTWEDLKELK